MASQKVTKWEVYFWKRLLVFFGKNLKFAQIWFRNLTVQMTIFHLLSCQRMMIKMYLEIKPYFMWNTTIWIFPIKCPLILFFYTSIMLISRNIPLSKHFAVHLLFFLAVFLFCLFDSCKLIQNAFIIGLQIFGLGKI